MAESNPVAFEVIEEEAEPQHVGLELTVFAFDDPALPLDVVPRRTDLKCLDELRGPGAGSFKIMRSDPKLFETPNLLDYRNLCKVYSDRKAIGAFLIQNKRTDFVNRDEKAGEFWEVSGGGLREWFHDAVVEPYRGIRRDSQSSRVFSFASERGTWYNASNWATPVIIQQYNLDPNNDPFGTAPAEWPDVPSANWVWGVANDAGSNPAPAGINFFRYEFTIAPEVGTKNYSVFAAAKDTFDIFIDAQQVIESRELNGYAKTWRADFELGPGSHILAARVKANGSGQAGLIAALFRVGDAETGTAATLLTNTGAPSDAVLRSRANVAQTAATAARLAATEAVGTPSEAAAESAAQVAEAEAVRADQLADQAEANTAAGNIGWVVNPYPDPAPGWTPGEILLTLLAEAAARGVKFPEFLNPTFTATTDSDGAAWPRSLDWSFDIGSEYSDVIDRLEELVCDVWIDPETLDLNVYIERGVHRDAQSPAVQPVKFEVGRNVVRAGEDGTSSIKNALLMSTEDGWQSLADGLTGSIAKYGRIEGYVSTGASGSVSVDLAQRIFGQRAEPEKSATYEIIDVTDARPFTHFFVGDWTLAPSADDEYTLAPRHIMSISAEEDEETGASKFALEFDTIFEDRAARYERWLKTTGDGTLGGSLANVSGGGSGGGGTPTSQNTQTGPGGLQGKAGPPGVVWRGTWSAAIQYAAKDLVTYQGQTWLAVLANSNTTPSDASSAWSIFARAGADGNDGLSLPYKGTWSSGTAYKINDVVTYLGSSYIAIATSTGIAPTDASKWSQIAAKGDRGETGALVARLTDSVTSPALAKDANWQGTIDLSVGYRLYHITTNVPARIRMYGTAAKQTTDLPRPIGLDPTGDHGLLFEFVTTSPVLSAYLSPLVDGASFETVPTSAIPITITNLGVPTSPVTVDLVYAVTE